MSNDLIKLRKSDGSGIGTGSGGITHPAEPYEPGGWVAPDGGFGSGGFVVSPPPDKPPTFPWPDTSLHSD